MSLEFEEMVMESIAKEVKARMPKNAQDFFLQKSKRYSEDPVNGTLFMATSERGRLDMNEEGYVKFLVVAGWLAEGEQPRYFGKAPLLFTEHGVKQLWMLKL